MIDLREVKSGDLIKSDDWNELVREVRRLGKLSVAAPLQKTDGAGGIGLSLASVFDDRFLVDVYNNSGSDCEKFHILGIDSNYYSTSTELESFKDKVAFNGITPTTASHKGKFLVCAQQIANGTMGKAWIAGACQVQIDVTDATHTTADVRNSDRAKLASGFDGNARIIWKESGTGTKWAIIARFGYGSSACT
jgi:hypothetical protein